MDRGIEYHLLGLIIIQVVMIHQGRLGIHMEDIKDLKKQNLLKKKKIRILFM